MDDLSDEMLMAYADGELSASESARVEARLAANPELERRLQAFLATRELLPQIFRQPMQERPPQRLVDIVMSAPMAPPAPAPARVAPARPSLGQRIADALTFQSSGFASAFAYAGIALLGGSVVAAGMLWMIETQRPASDIRMQQASLQADGDLARFLESARSGERRLLTQTVDPADGKTAATAQIKLTYLSVSQNYCRQYVVTSERTSAAGVACRGRDGIWRLKMHESVARGSSADGFMPAAGESVTTYLRSNMKTEAMGAEEEAAVLARGWKSP